MSPILTVAMIDTLKEGDKVRVWNPQTDDYVECLTDFQRLPGTELKIFFTTADSEVKRYNDNAPNLSYRDLIKHVRDEQMFRAAMPLEEMKELLRSGKYRIG